MPSKFSLFWSLLWAKIRGAGKWLIGAVIALAILIIALIGLNNQEDKKEDSSNKPEVAQIYEPSISTPLPPDTNSSTTESSGQVASASTTEVSSSTEASNSAEQNFIAPSTGIDSNKPIYYHNEMLGVKATLPAESIITENTDSAVFRTKSGALLYNIDAITTSDSLSTIYKQLKASSTISNIAQTSFSENSALKFSYQNFTGYVLVKNGKAYYIIGDAKNLNNITI